MPALMGIGRPAQIGGEPDADPKRHGNHHDRERVACSMLPQVELLRIRLARHCKRHDRAARYDVTN